MKAILIELPCHQSSLLTVKKVKKHDFDATFHFHDFCELSFVQKSNGKRIIGDSITSFHDGDLVLMSPNLPHMWYEDASGNHPHKNKSVEAIVIYFPLNFFEKVCNDVGELSKKRTLFEKANRGMRFSGKTKKKITKHLEKMTIMEGFSQVIEFFKIVNIMLHTDEYELLAGLGYSYSYNEKDTERMNKVYNYIMMNFTKPISLETIASIAHMTPPAFCTFFKKRAQKSFTRFLNELRTGHACKLLQNEKLSISDVCYESGYQNFVNFNKYFKQLIGKTPSTYRKEFLTISNF
ncbi:MAG: AraC family transcriptional regulator [Flavobacterium sp.]